VPRAVTIGTFDGVHRGHRALIQRCQELGESVVVTFDPHPRTVLGGQPPLHIQTIQERVDTLEALGVSEVEILRFDSDLANLSYEQFLLQIHTLMRFDHLVLGEGARLGKGRLGTPGLIAQMGAELGFQVHTVSPVVEQGARVSSSLIRDSIQRGDLSRAAHLLGRPFSLSAIVRPGAGRGQGLGFPTANCTVHGRLMPPHGVYAGFVRWDRQWHPAVMNYGMAPTFSRAEPLLEVHALQTHPPSLSGMRLEVIPGALLRPQRTFASKEELQQQLLEDCQAAGSWSSGIQIDWLP